MFKNFLKISVRNLFRNKIYSFINIMGLAIGLCCCILLMLYIKHEISYEKKYQNADQLYRIWLKTTLNGEIRKSAITTLTYGADLLSEFPEIKNTARTSTVQGGRFSFGNKEMDERFLYVDESFLNMFLFRALSGNIETALQNPNTIVLCNSLAQRLFGDIDPIGKSVSLNNARHLMVTAVIPDQPVNTHLQFQALLPLKDYPNQHMSYDGNFSFYTYVQLYENADVEKLRVRFPEFMDEKINNWAKEFGFFAELNIQKLSKMHLHSDIQHEMSPAGNMQNIYIYTAIAIFILLIACINFMNLTVAQSLKRAREIGIRKVLGSFRSMLIRQYLIESVMFSFIAFVISLILIEICLPPFNNFIGVELEFYKASELNFLVMLPLVALFTGILAGSYPAFYLSAFNPIKVIRGGFEIRNKRLNLKNVLVVLQYIISTSLIVSTIIIYLQVNYLNNKDLGYIRENVLIIQFNNNKQRDAMTGFKNELLQLSGVKNATQLSALPVHGITMNGYVPDEYEKPIMVHELIIDEDFMKTLEVELIDGDNFSGLKESDQNTCIVNEAAVKSFGWENAIGKTLHRNGKDFRVIGVVMNFHFTSLHVPVAPLILKNVSGYRYMAVRLNDFNRSQILEDVKSAWNNMLPNESMQSRFFNEYYTSMYKEESRFGTIFISFAVLAIFIASLGLLGLSSFILKQRSKEIGIRKILGSSTNRIFKLLSVNYIYLLVIANLIAFPIIWVGMGKWLKNFAYQIPIPWWSFVLAFLISVLLMFVTISIQTFKSARAKPADAIKYE